MNLICPILILLVALENIDTTILRKPWADTARVERERQRPAGSTFQRTERQPCPQQMFACRNKQCIARSYHCDGLNDCTDGSDEENCKYRSKSTPPPPMPAKEEARRCHDGKYACANGQCVHPAAACDGVLNCIDGSDEQDCADGKQTIPRNAKPVFPKPPKRVSPPYRKGLPKGYKCPQGLYMCANKECIPPAARCDGPTDCKDGSDEWDCDSDPMNFRKKWRIERSREIEKHLAEEKENEKRQREERAKKRHEKRIQEEAKAKEDQELERQRILKRIEEAKLEKTEESGSVGDELKANIQSGFMEQNKERLAEDLVTSVQTAQDDHDSAHKSRIRDEIISAEELEASAIDGKPQKGEHLGRLENDEPVGVEKSIAKETDGTIKHTVERVVRDKNGIAHDVDNNQGGLVKKDDTFENTGSMGFYTTRDENISHEHKSSPDEEKTDKSLVVNGVDDNIKSIKRGGDLKGKDTSHSNRGNVEMVNEVTSSDHNGEKSSNVNNSEVMAKDDVKNYPQSAAKASHLDGHNKGMAINDVKSIHHNGESTLSLNGGEVAQDDIETVPRHEENTSQLDGNSHESAMDDIQNSNIKGIESSRLEKDIETTEQKTQISDDQAGESSRFHDKRVDQKTTDDKKNKKKKRDLANGSRRRSNKRHKARHDRGDNGMTNHDYEENGDVFDSTQASGYPSVVHNNTIVKLEETRVNQNTHSERLVVINANQNETDLVPEDQRIESLPTDTHKARRGTANSEKENVDRATPPKRKSGRMNSLEEFMSLIPEHQRPDPNDPFGMRDRPVRTKKRNKRKTTNKSRKGKKSKKEKKSQTRKRDQHDSYQRRDSFSDEYRDFGEAPRKKRSIHQRDSVEDEPLYDEDYGDVIQRPVKGQRRKRDLRRSYDEDDYDHQYEYVDTNEGDVPYYSKKTEL